MKLSNCIRYNRVFGVSLNIPFELAVVSACLQTRTAALFFAWFSHG